MISPKSNLYCSMFWNAWHSWIVVKSFTFASLLVQNESLWQTDNDSRLWLLDLLQDITGNRWQTRLAWHGNKIVFKSYIVGKCVLKIVDQLVHYLNVLNRGLTFINISRSVNKLWQGLHGCHIMCTILFHFFYFFQIKSY